LDTNVIDLFKHQFAGRKELEKIEIHNANFVEALRGNKIDEDDFIYSDIYSTLNSDEALDHFEEFAPEYPGYYFWGFERLLLDSVAYHEIYIDYKPPLLQRFFRQWMTTTVAESMGPGADEIYMLETPLNNLYYPGCDIEYCQRFTKLVEEIY